MSDIQFMIWFFPILFIFHDFEEIIFMKPWTVKNGARLREKYPKIAERMLPHFSSLTTSSFALGVAEEFVLISIITISAYLTEWYLVWVGAFIAFTFHLFVHCVQGIAVKGYVPAIVTSVICLPVCCYFIVSFVQIYRAEMREIVLFSIALIAMMIFNLWAVHRGMAAFDKWLCKYQGG